jgi:hypothetical protein
LELAQHIYKNVVFEQVHGAFLLLLLLRWVWAVVAKRTGPFLDFRIRLSVFVAAAFRVRLGHLYMQRAGLGGLPGKDFLGISSLCPVFQFLLALGILEPDGVHVKFLKTHPYESTCKKPTRTDYLASK